MIEEGSLSGAARRLNLTQPTIARQIEALEAAVGADLFVRSQRGLSPTEVALVVVELVVSNATDDMLQREADVARRNFEPTQTALVARRSPPIALGRHARPDYLNRRGAPLNVADLADHDLIGFGRETPAIRAIVQRYPTFGREAYALRADSDLARLAAIRAGFGIGIYQVPGPVAIRT